jgi:4-hydroxy-tetrahydrodipicolinate synthase
LRIVLYHIPKFSALPITFGLIERLRASYSTVFVGIKDSAGDLSNMEALTKRFPGFAVLAGADPLMLPLLKKGGAGAITATSNLVARELAYVFRHFADSSRTAEVDAAQARVIAARNRASHFAQMPSLKVLLAERTGDAGWRRVRPPLVSLSEDECSMLLEGTDDGRCLEQVY